MEHADLRHAPSIRARSDSVNCGECRQDIVFRVYDQATLPTNRVTMTKPTTIDAYLANVTGDKRVALDRLRETIRAIVPAAEECISYAIPAFRVDGNVVAGFVATKRGCSYFPFSGTTLSTLADDLVGYDLTKSALHFDPAKPLPKTLVRKLLAARIAEIGSAGSTSTRRGSRPPRRGAGRRQLKRKPR